MDIQNAIPGVPSITRKRESLANKATFETVPNWLKSWTREQATSYIETNVTNLAEAKTVLSALAEAVIILRDVLKLYYNEG